MTYKPSPRVAKILDLALSIVQSVDYEVPARWVFYQLVQRLGFAKSAYKQLLGWLSKARKGFWHGWTPDTLADDTRSIHGRDGGFKDRQKWFESFLEESCTLEVRSKQPNIVLVLFEAAAMAPQFDHYLEPLRISTAPFRGDASIPLKSKIAKRITALHRQFPDKPVRVLYFGDYDPKGLSIPIAALKDIWRWINAPEWGNVIAVQPGDGQTVIGTPDGKFQWIRVGINKDQIDSLDIPENPEKPGTYQWEALSDEQAGQMILGAVGGYWEQSVIEETLDEEKAAEIRWRSRLRRMLKTVRRGRPPRKVRTGG